MPLPPLAGHEEARAAISSALRRGTLPASLLIHGPKGIGKERLALWVAALLLCESSEAGTQPCGTCKSCRLAGRLEHPDLHWFFPLPRPSGAAGDKLRAALETARNEELQEWRLDPLRIPSYDKAPAHFVASIQSLQQLAAVRPAMGSRKVFIVGDAERMVPQESSPEAANAFLKLLEEPPPDTTLILTAEQPGALLPTIQSRVLPLRLRLLAAPEIAAFLEEQASLSPADASAVAAEARGSIRTALEIVATRGDKDDASNAPAAVARTMLEAALSSSPVSRFAVAHDMASTGARNDLMDVLDALGLWLRDLMALCSGADSEVVRRETADLLRGGGAEIRPTGVARAIERVLDAKRSAFGNVNPQLIVTQLLRQIQLDLRNPA